MRSVFQSFDKDGNGEIDKQELKKAFEEMGKRFSDAELQRMMELMDTDQSGTKPALTQYISVLNLWACPAAESTLSHSQASCSKPYKWWSAPFPFLFSTHFALQEGMRFSIVS
ncbi:hypothetical protein CAPTEDRAFT_185328 [Capitella teleta]|uniref:EF-hand domain-containing protein n=1 Tax=Capitella teleta TaxID=283909 RepID=R7T7Z6_CAPTE|nr:hypothetical protein CAPTEDRAFT_185328 [Capitella teleta]|eukprot:ELT87550.1 hypothetical protein CAPTEDRAFT_185328 [Capitella teleta]